MEDKKITIDLKNLSKWKAIADVVKDILLDENIPREYKDRLLDAYHTPEPKSDIVDIEKMATERTIRRIK